jgi:hypothetical protein
VGRSDTTAQGCDRVHLAPSRIIFSFVFGALASSDGSSGARSVTERAEPAAPTCCIGRHANTQRQGACKQNTPACRQHAVGHQQMGAGAVPAGERQGGDALQLWRGGKATGSCSGCCFPDAQHARHPHARHRPPCVRHSWCATSCRSYSGLGGGFAGGCRPRTCPCRGWPPGGSLGSRTRTCQTRSGASSGPPCRC